jgi:hypothetical protein
MTRPVNLQRRRGLRLARLVVGAIALLSALAATEPALGELGPPSPVPAVTKRKCTKYVVVRGPTGPVARCSVYTQQTFKRRSTKPSSTAVGGNGLRTPPPAPATQQPTQASHSSPTGSSPPATARPARPTPGSAAHLAAPTQSSSDVSLGLVLAILAASGLACGGLLVIARRAPRRRRDCQRTCNT